MANIYMTNSNSNNILKRNAEEEGTKTQTKCLKKKVYVAGNKKQRQAMIPLFKMLGP